MRVLVLSPSLTSLPVAVFWAEGDELRSHIVEEGPATRSALYTLVHREPSVVWEDVFGWLSERTLQTHRWDAFDLGEGASPVELLNGLRAQI
jgi:hypothetical protein